MGFLARYTKIYINANFPLYSIRTSVFNVRGRSHIWRHLRPKIDVWQQNLMTLLCPFVNVKLPVEGSCLSCSTAWKKVLAWQTFSRHSVIRIFFLWHDLSIIWTILRKTSQKCWCMRVQLVPGHFSPPLRPGTRLSLWFKGLAQASHHQ